MERISRTLVVAASLALLATAAASTTSATDVLPCAVGATGAPSDPLVNGRCGVGTQSVLFVRAGEQSGDVTCDVYVFGEGASCA